MKEIVFIGSRSSAGKESLLSGFVAASPLSIIADCSLEYNALIKVMQPSNIREKRLPIFRGFSFDQERCIHCGMCLGVCKQDALAFLEEQMTFYEYRCTHCASCVKWCPVMALSHEEQREISLYHASTRFGFLVYSHNFLEPSLQPEMINAIRKQALQIARDRGAELVLVNGSRGLRNTTLKAIENTDALVAVISPAAHALKDLERIIHFCRKAGHEPLVIINMIDIDPLQSLEMEKICENMAVAVIGKVTYNASFRDALIRNQSINEIIPGSELAVSLENIWERILDHISLRK
ncbi:MAG: 4Fe-4S binding protein [Bacteroidota bacterium]